MRFSHARRLLRRGIIGFELDGFSALCCSGEPRHCPYHINAIVANNAECCEVGDFVVLITC